LDCGGKRSATPLSDRTNSGIALHLPPQSKSVHWQALIFGSVDQSLLRALLRVARTIRRCESHQSSNPFIQ